jgi:hypothetical protein
LIEHCGDPKTGADFVRTLVMTDFASGWAERSGTRQVARREAMNIAAAELPFAMRGIDTDNDSAFMNETLFELQEAQTRTDPLARA